MATAELDALDTRVTSLERQNLHLRMILLLTILIGGLLACAGFATQSAAEVTASRFVLVDSSGTIRAELSVNAYNVTRLGIYGPAGDAPELAMNQQGYPYLDVTVSAAGASLSLSADRSLLLPAGSATLTPTDLELLSLETGNYAQISARADGGPPGVTFGNISAGTQRVVR